MKRTPNTQRVISKIDCALQNPYIGFTSFQHFRNEPLFSDCAITEGWAKEHYPVYDWVEQNGRQQGYYPDTEIAYIRVLWKDFEIEEGVFNFALTDEIFKKAAQNNQSVMFRLVPHTTRQNEDVPDWLKKIIDCPPRPDASRVKDSPKDPIFLKKFCNAVEVFGNRYDKLENFYAMDISITGAWGEGHGFFEYTEEALKLLMDTYLRVFKNTHLLGQVCAPQLVNYACKTRPIGYRADGLGGIEHMQWYLPKNIVQMKDVWQKSPVSFETFWVINEWKKQEWDLDDIIEQSLKWHVSSINAKSSPIPPEWKEKIDYWLKKMGYRFSIRLFEYPANANAGDTVEFSMWIENSGVAPIYNYLPFEFCLKNGSTEICFETKIDARNWMPGDFFEECEITLPKDLPSGNYSIWCRLGGYNLPIVKFASDTTYSEEGFYYLADISIED